MQLTTADRALRAALGRGSFLVLFSWRVAALTAPAGATTLQGALELAYQTNPKLQAARAQLRLTDEGVPQALSGWRPHVTILTQAGTAYRDNSVDSRMAPEHLTPQEYELNLAQNLYTSGRVTAEVKQSREQVEAGRATLAVVEDDVLLAAEAEALRPHGVIRLPPAGAE